MNRWTQRVTNPRECPFCGKESVNVIHAQDKYIGANEYGVKKVRMKCYCKCNNCHARSTSIKYVAYINAAYNSGLTPPYSDEYKVKAINLWNRRFEDYEE